LLKIRKKHLIIDYRKTMSILLLYILAFFFSFSIVLYSTPKILLWAITKKLIDKPNKRKVHTVLASRLGGLSFFPAIFFSTTLCTIIALFLPEDPDIPSSFYKEIINFRVLYLMAAFFLIYVIGVIDDIKGMRYKKKIVYQVIAALLIILSGTWIHNMCGVFGFFEIPAYIGITLTVLFIVFIINAINLIDGIDGLSSGLSIIITAVFIILFYYFNKQLSLLLSSALLGMLISFFRYNILGVEKKYKIFMGDSGSLLIGTILSYFAISGSQLGVNSSILSAEGTFLISSSAMLVPCLDTLNVVCHRIKNGKSIFHPDKNHIHHKLMAIGFSQRKTLITILTITIFFLILNSLLFNLMNINTILFIDVVIFTAIHILISKKIKSVSKKQKQSR